MGRFRRNHLVPVPVMADLAALSSYLHRACEADGGRQITGRDRSVAMDWTQGARGVAAITGDAVCHGGGADLSGGQQ